MAEEDEYDLMARFVNGVFENKTAEDMHSVFASKIITQCFESMWVFEYLPYLVVKRVFKDGVLSAELCHLLKARRPAFCVVGPQQ